MNKIAIICNDSRHAALLLIRPLGLNPKDCVVITPETTDKMYGYKEIEYYEMRPMYAREHAYAESHQWKAINHEQLAAYGNS